MEFSTGELLQVLATVSAIGGGAAYIKSEIKHLTEQVKQLNGSIKKNAEGIHEHGIWHEHHLEKFHSSKK